MLGKLRPRPGSVTARKRVGRGIGSGLGKTAGRGYKGQRARSGGKKGMQGFEGGQSPMQRRLPKRGFVNANAVLTAVITTKHLNGFENNAVVTPQALKDVRLVPKWAEQVKLILKGDLSKKLSVQLHKISKGAQAAIQAKGGSAEILK